MTIPFGRAALVALSFLWPREVPANAGGFDYGVKFTGSVAPFQPSGAKQVRILEEDLRIALRRTDAAVVVRYTMESRSDQPIRVKMGFPVEATRASDFEEPPQEDRRKDLLDSIQQLHGYSVTLDGKPVPATYTIEPFASGKLKPFPGSEVLKGIAGWMVSEPTFPPGARVTLEIRYVAEYFGGEWGVSDDSQVSPSRFHYRLSTGAVWAGPIEKGTVTLLADGIASSEVKIKTPTDRFERDRDRFTWSFENLEPTLDDDLQIEAVPGYFVPGAVGQYRVWEAPRTAPLRYIRRGGEDWGNWAEASQRFTATASSTLKPAKDHDFVPRHLAEEASSYPWCEGAPGLGKGEWVELVPAEPRPLEALSIIPGYARGPSVRFRQNGRPTRVEILVNGEHRFVATLGDKPVDQLVPVLDFDEPARKIRITILDALNGTHWEDTCIARVVLYERLAETPDVHGSR